MSDQTEIYSNITATTDPGLNHTRGRVYNVEYIHTSLNIGLGTIITIVGLIGNVLSFVVLSRDRRSQVASLLLKTLSVVDSVVLISTTLNGCLHPDSVYLSYTYRSLYLEISRGLSAFFMSTSRAVSIWLTVLIASIRYIAIRYPLWMRAKLSLARTRLMIAMLVIAVVVYFIPAMYIGSLHVCREFTGCNDTTTLDSHYYTPGEHEFELYHLLLGEVLITIIPLVLLICLSALLLIAYHKAVNLSAQLIAQNNKEENQITLSIIMVVVVLIICQIPSFALILNIYLKKPYFYGGVWHVIYILRAFLLGLNSSVNVLIYSICCKSFRVKLINMIGKRSTHQSALSLRTLTSYA